MALELMTLQAAGQAVLRDLQRQVGLDPNATDGSLALYGVSASAVVVGDDPDELGEHRLSFTGFESQSAAELELLAHLAARLLTDWGVSEPVTITLEGFPGVSVVANPVADETATTEPDGLESWQPPAF